MNETSKMAFSLKTSALRAYVMLAVLALIWLFFQYKTGGTFLSSDNLSNLSLQTSVTGILAVGMLMLIVAGQIDLSVGSVLGFAGAVAAIALNSFGYNLVFVILLAIMVGLLIGLFHGFLTSYFNIPAFIVTLGGLLAWRGAVKGVTQSETIPISDAAYKYLGQGSVPYTLGWILAGVAILFVLAMAINRARRQETYGLGKANYTKELLNSIIPIIFIVVFIYVMNSSKGVPIPVLILLLVALLGAFITGNTTFGRYLYAIGGNPDAARLSGINNRRNILKVFALLGALTGIAALINTARLSSASTDDGTLKELDAIAACVIGGASLMGGRGTIFGACLGALIMASLDNGMSLMRLDDYLKDIIKGAILVSAVGLDMFGRKNS
ncbi:MAG TPA: sugar ABC transporter permease [Pyrinomonadaceae bacterium]|jgi:D-xylose transport system permease protein|nr:sugar ABC transporter permease [Pyrinomonadaceae bacterium]